MNPMPSLKQCSRCKKLLPRNDWYFNRNKNKKDGLEYHCRGCRHQWTGDEFLQDILRMSLAVRGHKMCRDCGLIKPHQDYRASQSCIDGYRPECKVCMNTAQKKHYQKEEVQTHIKAYRRREDVRVRERAREARPENRAKKHEYDKSEGRKAYKRAYHQRDDIKERMRKYMQEPERRDRYNAKKRENYRHDIEVKSKIRVNTQLRRARILSQQHTLTTADWQTALRYFEFKCAVCGRLESEGYVLAADHWIPLVQGGATTADNMIPLCHARPGFSGSCNRSKWYKRPELWLRQKFGEQFAIEIEQRIAGYFEWIMEHRET